MNDVYVLWYDYEIEPLVIGTKRACELHRDGMEMDDDAFWIERWTFMTEDDYE